MPGWGRAGVAMEDDLPLFKRNGKRKKDKASGEPS
jgi:hypothetical protein